MKHTRVFFLATIPILTAFFFGQVGFVLLHTIVPHTHAASVDPDHACCLPTRAILPTPPADIVATLIFLFVIATITGHQFVSFVPQDVQSRSPPKFALL